MPTETDLRGRLSGGQQRADRYGFWKPAGHVAATDMADKLYHRASETGQLRCYIGGHPLDGTTVWHLDHVRPLAAGGRHCIHNLEIACGPCNLGKADLDLYDPPLDVFEPLLDRLRATPTADLWDLDPKLARRVAIAPRPVPVDETIGGFPTLPVVWAVLASQPDPYRAMKLADLADRTAAYGKKVGKGQLDREWEKLMGMSRLGSQSKARRQVAHDRRRPPSVVVATRVVERAGQWGVRGMRIRFRVDVRPPDHPNGPVPSLPRPGPYPDLDEIDVPATRPPTSRLQLESDDSR